MIDDIFETSGLSFPPYLTAGDQRELFSELQRFPDSRNFYWVPRDTDPLQGDAYPGFTFLFVNGDGVLSRQAKGVIVSNSCDISVANEPDRSRRLLYAPLLSLKRYLGRLNDLGKSEQQVSDLATTIREQRVSHLFFLPAYGDVLPECIVPLDSIQSEELQRFYDQPRDRLFSLSQYGWWIFLVKLSIHFVRMQEGVRRFPPASA